MSFQLRYVQEDLDAAGGLPAVMKTLLNEGLLNGDCLTVTGKSLAENLAPLTGDQQVIRPFADPIKKTGHIHILRKYIRTVASASRGCVTDE